MEPTSHCHADFFIGYEIVSMEVYFSHWLRLDDSLLPRFLLHRADEHVIVTNVVEAILGKRHKQQMLNFVLMSNQNIAMATVPVSVIQGDHVFRDNMNQ